MPSAKFKPNPKYDFESLLEKWKQRPAESDHHPPETNAVNFVGLRRHVEEAELYVQRTTENNDFLKKNFLMQQTRGATNPFREPHTVVQMARYTLGKRMRAQTLMRDNKILMQKIQQVKGDIEVTSHRPLDPKCQRLLDYKRFSPPTEILEKYTNITFPKDELLWRCLRPRVFFEFQIVRTRYERVQLGRMTIELYTEAAPLVVREFIKCCICGRHDRFRMLRLFPNLWLEGEIKLDESNKLIHRPLEYDLRALNHDASSSILSFPMEFVNGFRFGVLSFTFSSRPLHVLNGKRVAFGRIIRGNKIMEVLQEYGTKNGKLKKPILISYCGLEF